MSSGLSKETTIDADKVFQEMQKQPKPAPTSEPGTSGSGADASGASGAPGADEAKDDPMKGLMESLKNDQAKKR